MATQRRMGVYWGSQGINLVEINKETPIASTFISFADLENNPVIGISHLSEDIRLLDLVQKAVRSGSFSTGKVFLSFPSKDIILRWFIIPWVKPEEIQGVVRFEAKKYMPFPIDEVIFNYYPLTINKDGARQIGIAFTAIKKTHYERYSNVLIQAGLNIVYSEPSSMSLLRALVFKKIISTDQVYGIFTSHEDSGEISVASQGYIRFIRDFSLRSSNIAQRSEAVDLFKEKLFNEVRMSLDYFARTNPGPDLKKVFVVSSSGQQSLYDAMGEDIGVPVQVVDPAQILEKFSSLPSLSYVRAFGVALSGAVPSVINFNLSEGQVRNNEKDVTPEKPPLVQLNTLILAGTVVFSLFLSYISWSWALSKVQAKEAEKTALSDKLGIYYDMPQDDIDIKAGAVKKRIKDIKALTLKSNWAPFLVKIVQSIPEGMWFDTLSLTNRLDPKSQAQIATISMTGYVSLADTAAEFDLVNNFLDRLNSDSMIKTRFQNMKLKALQTSDIDVLKTKLTSFTIENR